MNQFSNGKRGRIFKSEHRREIAFPVGGIGSGSISISGYGELIDWEIFNRPNKNYRPRYTFFSAWAKEDGKDSVFRVLEARYPSYHSRHRMKFDINGSAPCHRFAPGLKRMEDCEITSQFPFFEVRYKDDEFPLSVTLEAFNPFIPLNPDDSSLPAAVFFLHLKNSGNNCVETSVAFNIENMTGNVPLPNCCGGSEKQGRCINELRKEDDISYLFLMSEDIPEDSPAYGTICAGVAGDNPIWMAPWPRGGWWDDLQHFCDTFAQTGKTGNITDPSPSEKGKTDINTIGIRTRIEPGKTVRIPVILTWHFPNFKRYWTNEMYGKEACNLPRWKNWYDSKFGDAGETLLYVFKNLDRLEKESRDFSESLYESDKPEAVIHSVADNLSILKSPTCLRLEDGSFYGFEGCCKTEGCCEGSCSHVWNYAQALPMLFPSLERSLRENELKYCVRESDGHMQFRMPLPPGTPAKHDFHAAADGQLGTVLKMYREYLVSGDEEWLAKWWPQTRNVLNYAFVSWDADRDGLIEGLHHNTYDIEFLGPEPMAQSFYLAALLAGEKMAAVTGDNESQEEYRRLFESGFRLMDERLWNGEYYCQKIEYANARRYQYGKGCLSDQLIGQWYADILGLGDICNPERIKKAIKAIFDYNWKNDLSEINNAQRAFVLNHESGLLLCTWPDGGRPDYPFPYSDEVWYGIEYEVASLLMHRGFKEQAMTIIKAMRERHNGANRNPWNEVECGNHYARSLASWSLFETPVNPDDTIRRGKK